MMTPEFISEMGFKGCHMAETRQGLSWIHSPIANTLLTNCVFQEALSGICITNVT